MDINSAKQKALKMLNQDGLVMTLGTNNPAGAPDLKAMMKFKNDGLKTVWFCSCTSARRTKILQQDNRASLYAYEWKPTAQPIVCRGLMLTGTMELSWDNELRRSLWSEALKVYYTGYDDPEFVVLQFTPKQVNYSEDGASLTFEV